MRSTVQIAAVLLLSAPSLSQAIAVVASTAEALTFRDCIAGVTACDNVSPTVIVKYAGPPGATFASAIIADPQYGVSTGSVALSGEIGAPIFRASSTAEARKRSNSNLAALQRYTYGGTTTVERTFGGTLTYSQMGNGGYPSTVTGLYAAIDVFTLPESTVDVGDTPQSNFSTLFALDQLPGYNSLGYSYYHDAEDAENGVGNVSVTVTLEPGDTIWVWASLQTPAANGGWIDASHTFATRWDNPADLTPGAVADVPEPANACLLALGLVGVGAAARRRTRQGRARPQGRSVIPVA